MGVLRHRLLRRGVFSSARGVLRPLPVGLRNVEDFAFGASGHSLRRVAARSQACQICVVQHPSLRRHDPGWRLCIVAHGLGACRHWALPPRLRCRACARPAVSALLLLVLLTLPKAKAWQREVFATGGKDKAGLMVALSLFAFFYAAVSIPSCVSRPRTHVYVAETEAKAINCGLDENNSSREKGGEWVDPSTCTNSTQFVNALYDKLGMERRHDEWCIAVNPPNDDRFPVLFTANIDPRELLCPQDEDQPLKLTCPKEWGGVCFKFCEKMGVVHYKNGVSQIVKWHRFPKQIFCSGIPKPGPDTYFLTPTGRVDFAERQGSAMAISMNLKLISIDKSERCVVAEFLLENCSQRGVFVFGSKDALTTYFMKDGVWVLCSTANDVGNEPAEERGLFVEKGNVLRVSGRIPQECLLAKWFLVVGIGTRSKDEMESIVASPIYSRDNESGDRLSFKMEMNSVFKGRLKAFIANE